MIITEMTKMSGRGFGDLCSVISECKKRRGVSIRTGVLVKAMEGGIDRSPQWACFFSFLLRVDRNAPQ